MIPTDCKRVAEVDFSIAEVSRHAAGEKSTRHGHPSTLHLWWARRPVASSRAVLLALLWPDPCDPLCPPVFKAEAKKLVPQVGGCDPGTTDQDLRQALRFVGGEIQQQAEQELADLYSKDPETGATPIAYLWARTVRREAPNCGAARSSPVRRPRAVARVEARC